jgi:hypothetical protein
LWPQIVILWARIINVRPGHKLLLRGHELINIHPCHQRGTGVRMCLSTKKLVLIKRAQAYHTHISKSSIVINPTCP